MSTLLRTVRNASLASQATLVGEMVGYIVLGAADLALSRPFLATFDTLAISETGEVLSGGAVTGPDESEASLRKLLLELLAAVRTPAPNLLRVAQSSGPAGIPSLVLELESALVPVNRKAARRALSRLARETKRFEGLPSSESSLLVAPISASAEPTMATSGREPVAVMDARAEVQESEIPTIPAPLLEPSSTESRLSFEPVVEGRSAWQSVPSPSAPVAVPDHESRDERYLSDDTVLGAMLSMRSSHRGTEWADEDDFLTELWAARSVRPPEAFLAETAPPSAPEAPVLPTLPSEREESQRVAAEPQRVAAEPQRVAAEPQRVARLIQMGESPSPLPVTVREHESPMPFEVHPGEEVRHLVPERPSVYDGLTAAPSERPPIVVTEPSPAPLSTGRRIQPLLELGEPAPRQRSDVSELLKTPSAQVPASAELIHSLRNLSGIGAPRIPRI